MCDVFDSITLFSMASERRDPSCTDERGLQTQLDVVLPVRKLLQAERAERAGRLPRYG